MSAGFSTLTPSRTRWPVAAFAVFMGLLSANAMAQGVYRIVGPDGRVSYSDQAPPSANARPVAGGGGREAAGPQLPFELRQTSTRYPVTLYTTRECAPCNSGRNLLNARGIPYSEKTITTEADARALTQLSGAASLPVLTVGGQQIKGFTDGEWTRYLDAAGYPKQSALPAGYKQAAAMPLVAVQENVVPPAAPTPAAAPAPAAQPPVSPAPSNPAGIRF